MRHNARASTKHAVEIVNRTGTTAGVIILSSAVYLLRLCGFFIRLSACASLYLIHYMLSPWYAVAPKWIPDTRWVPRNVRLPRFPAIERIPRRPPGNHLHYNVDQDNIAINGGTVNAPIDGDVNYGSRARSRYRRP